MAKERGGPSDGDHPEGPDDRRRDGGRDPKADAGGNADAMRRRDGLPQFIHRGLRDHEQELTGALAALRQARSGDRATPVERELAVAGVLRDRGELRLVRGEPQGARQDHRDARRSVADALSLAARDDGWFAEGQRLQAHGLAAVFAADALRQGSSDNHRQLARQSLAALEQRERTVGDRPYGDKASPWRLRLWEFELRAIELRLDQSSHPETAERIDHEANWLRLKAIQGHDDFPRRWDPLWPDLQRDLLVAEWRYHKERSVTDTMARMQQLVDSYCAQGQRTEAGRACLILGTDLAKRAVAEGATPGSRPDSTTGLWVAATAGVHLAKMLSQESPGEYPSTRAGLGLAGRAAWTETAMLHARVPAATQGWKDHLQPALHQLAWAGDPSAPVLHWQIRTGHLELPPNPLFGPWHRPNAEGERDLPGRMADRDG